MSKRSVAAIFGISILSAITLYVLFGNNRHHDQTQYISDTTGKVKLKDIKNHFTKIDFNKENSKEIFSEGVVNKYTIKFFKSLQIKFRSLDYDSHLNSIHDYLFSRMPHDEAEQLYKLYVKYIGYEKEMAARMQSWGMPKSPEHMLEMLSRIQKSQSDYFGEETADILFGTEIKAREYPIRRKIIVSDKDLYGREKEEKLKKLNQDMWGSESESVGSHKTDYDNYREKLDIYSKDLLELTEDERKKKIYSYRKNFFSPEAVKKMEEVDNYIKEEELSEKKYRMHEQQILSDLNLDEDEKKQAVEELQSKFFGKDGAERWRKREILRKALQNK